MALDYLRNVDTARAAGARGELLIHESGAFRLSPPGFGPPIFSRALPSAPRKTARTVPAPSPPPTPEPDDDWIVVDAS